MPTRQLLSLTFSPIHAAHLQAREALLSPIYKSCLPQQTESCTSYSHIPLHSCLLLPAITTKTA